MTGDRCDLSIVIPVRNDGMRVLAALQAVDGHLASREDWEVLVVDDASEDDTCAQVLAFSLTHPNVFLLRNPTALGCGYASRHGVNLARGERIALMTPDLPAPIGLLDQLEAALRDGHDLAVISCRTDRARPLPPVRIRSQMMRSLFTSPGRPNRPGEPARLLLFQLYRRRAAMELFRRQRLHGPSFAIEILYLARRYGYSVLEIGVGEPGRKGRRAGADPRDDLTELLKIRMHRLRGDYG